MNMPADGATKLNKSFPLNFSDISNRLDFFDAVYTTQPVQEPVALTDVRRLNSSASASM